MRGGVTSLVSLGSGESRWGALSDSWEEGRSHLQPNKQLDTESPPPALVMTDKRVLKIAV